MARRVKIFIRQFFGLSANPAENNDPWHGNSSGKTKAIICSLLLGIVIGAFFFITRDSDFSRILMPALIGLLVAGSCFQMATNSQRELESKNESYDN